MDGESRTRSRRFLIVNAIQLAAIFVIVQICANVGRPDLTAAGVEAIVGLHFIPLAPVFRAPILFGTAALMVAFAAGSAALHGGHATALACASAGLILWSSAIARLVPIRSAVSAA